MSETSPCISVNPVNANRLGTIGIAVPSTEVRIIDDAGREVGAGEPGELVVRGPQVMLGYWNRPDESAGMIRNGWLHTGDVAVMDEEGYFKIVDRLKDMVLVSGFNVYPTEIERVLLHHPKIAKCCVAGVPDDKTGEAVKAYIVLKPGQTVTAEEITAWCREPEQGLTSYRVPKQVEFRDSLPETIIGKVLRRVLQAEERERAAGSGS
jgi:long-chain acyl-CoA synthetase